MSLIITIHTNEGIIMASDSRTTFNKQDFSPLPDGKGAIITNNQGVHYSDTTNKTFLTKNNIGVKQADGTVTYEKHNAPPIPWNFFSLQDAIDFSKYAMNTTIETMRFQERLKTVNAPIDILAIKPAGAFWVQKKELHA